ncbi:MAG: pantoate--beta-alanine ligase [Candidatus Margulisiibacteriota bacterium]
MKTVHSLSDMSALSDRIRERGLKLAFVPTMGALHEGHLSLITKAREYADQVVVSIFVNPIQFAPGEDFERYPRDLNGDKKKLKPFEPLTLFCPSASALFPPDFKTRVEVEEISQKLCGKFRLGHFKGVATVVAKLFNIVKPHFAVFGEKDYQQLLVIRQLVRDLNLGVKIVSCPTVREYDGLALSSRNRNLTPQERKAATVLYRALTRAKKEIEGGESDSRKILLSLGRLIGFEPTVRVEYIAIVDPETLREVKDIKGRVLVALAARLGKTRLIDNLLITP